MVKSSNAIFAAEKSNAAPADEAAAVVAAPEAMPSPATIGAAAAWKAVLDQLSIAKSR